MHDHVFMISFAMLIRMLLSILLGVLGLIFCVDDMLPLDS